MWPYLFSIDLEDVRFWMEGGTAYKERVPQNTARYLEWLARNNAKATFFTVGDVAEAYPQLIADIVAEGHEIACHTYRHVPLDRQGEENFVRDLAHNIEALHRAGATRVTGFRAPVFSLTVQTAWAHRRLAQAGIAYSSSVLPAPSPLYGWPGFGQAPRQVEGVWELPITLGQVGPLRVPFAGGVYFRLLPPFMLKYLAKKVYGTGGAPVLGYFHPYDVDEEQERFMHPGINGSKVYNMLMYMGRSGVFAKLDSLVAAGARIETYAAYIARALA